MAPMLELIPWFSNYKQAISIGDKDAKDKWRLEEVWGSGTLACVYEASNGLACWVYAGHEIENPQSPEDYRDWACDIEIYTNKDRENIIIEQQDSLGSTGDPSIEGINAKIEEFFKSAEADDFDMFKDPVTGEFEIDPEALRGFNLPPIPDGYFDVCVKYNFLEEKPFDTHELARRAGLLK